MSDPAGGAVAGAAAVVAARGVVKSFGDGPARVEVLRGVDLEVGRGESLSVRGESGSGKTTLLHVLAGLEPADAGVVTWLGRPLPRGAGARAAERPAHLGMVFQAHHLVPDLDALENVLLARRVAGRLRAADRARALELLERVGLADRRRHRPAQLSGGECQRVALARALLNRPPLVLADEPTGNLDERTAAGVMDLLLELVAGTGAALVLVTHHRGHAARCARHVRLHLGRIGDEAAPAGPGASRIDGVETPGGAVP